MAQTKGENTSKASAPQIREFRFKAGRPKRRRKPSLNGQDKPRKDVSNPGCSDTTPARGEPQIFAGLEDHRFVEEDYDTLASNILYPQQVKESLLSGSEHSLSDLPCRKLVASEESWPCESVDEAEASEPNSSGSSTTISSSWNDAYVVPSRAQPDPAWSLVDGSASSRERCSPMSFISSTTTVSPGILHADLPAKFSEVFARCRFPDSALSL
ncbi:hypothetical protein MMC16_004598 [Acarospora aff. strigata]|nr:hypothetical protein [Acarospora aff. strigata]